MIYFNNYHKNIFKTFALLSARKTRFVIKNQNNTTSLFLFAPEKN